MELYVTKCALYPDATEVDIRGWLIDDNAGNFNTTGGCTAGVGINAGHIRFAHVSAWENVPVGTVIVIFNGADNCYNFTVNESGSGPYFINANSTGLLERTGTGGTPSSSDCDYCDNSYTATGSSTWASMMGLSNTADAIQVRCPVCPESEAGFFHGVGYGSSFGSVNAGTNDLGGAYFSGNGTERSYALTGTGCGTLGDAGGWTRYSVPAAGTPPATAGVVDAGVLAWLEECQVPCCGSFEPPAVVQKHGYRFGFNGQEKDDEIYGSTGTSYTAEFWQYDARTAQRWNIDPVIKPWESPYATFARNPICLIDPNGANATKYEDEAGNLITETNDGNDATVTIGDQHLDAFKKDLAQVPVDKSSPSNNAKWISNYSLGMSFEEGDNVPDWAIGALSPGASKASLGLAAVGLGLEGGKFAAGRTTYRLFNMKGTNFSPKLYPSGWQGGSAGRITTYGLGKTIGFAGKGLGVFGMAMSADDLISGEVSPVQGTMDIIMGGVGTFGGYIGGIWSLSYEAGKHYGPSKWYGEDDTKWFK